MTDMTLNGATDVGTLIGALELGATMDGIDDGALEATLRAGPPPTMPGYPRCNVVGDAVLEVSAAMAAGPTLPSSGCHFIGDGALESTAGLHLGPTGMTCPPPQTMRPVCRYIDDGALEG